MASTAEVVYRTFRTRKGAENLVAKDAQWLSDGSDWVVEGDFFPYTYKRITETTLVVRKADNGTFQVVRVTKYL